MSGLFLTDYSVYGFLPNLLTLGGRGFDPTTYSLVYGFALFMAFLGYNFYGWLSDIAGQKNPDHVVLRLPGRLRHAVYYVLYHAALARNLKLAILGTCMAGYAEAGLGRSSGLPLRAIPHQAARGGRWLRLFRRRHPGSLVPLYVLWAHKIPFISASKDRTPGFRRQWC